MKQPTPITEFLPSPEDLIGVTYDHDASTATHRVYRSQSDSDSGKVYRVVLSDEGDRCPCLGFTHHGHCRHQARARRFEARRWWIRLLREYREAELVGVYATHESHLLADNGDAEDVAACEAVVFIQTARETQVRRAA